MALQGLYELEKNIWPLEAVNNITPDELLQHAKNAAEMAYVPYSNFHVGSAMLFNGGEILKGCNVENASFGMTICAERTAVVKMVSEGKNNPVAIGVVGSPHDKDDYLKVPCPPCGACRQTLMEFAPDLLVVLASPVGAKVYRLKDLLPLAFEL